MPTKSKREELRRLLAERDAARIKVDELRAKVRETPGQFGDEYKKAEREFRSLMEQVGVEAYRALPSLLDALDEAETALKGIIGVPVESVPGHIETMSGWHSYSSRCHGCMAKEKIAADKLATIHNLLGK